MQCTAACSVQLLLILSVLLWVCEHLCEVWFMWCLLILVWFILCLFALVWFILCGAIVRASLCVGEL